MADYMMALDAGTTSNRCILFDRHGRVCSVAQQEFTQYYPTPGYVEHDAEEILHNAACRRARGDGKNRRGAADIAAIGITNQRETTVVWDKQTGKPVCHAIVWQCRRTAAYCDALKGRGLTDMIRTRTGLMPDAYFSGTKLRWILENVPAPERAPKRASCSSAPSIHG